MDGIGEVVRLQEPGDPVIGAIIGQHGAEQRLLRLQIDRRHPLRQSNKDISPDPAGPRPATPGRREHVLAQPDRRQPSRASCLLSAAMTVNRDPPVLITSGAQRRPHSRMSSQAIATASLGSARNCSSAAVEIAPSRVASAGGIAGRVSRAAWSVPPRPRCPSATPSRNRSDTTRLGGADASAPGGIVSAIGCNAGLAGCTVRLPAAPRAPPRASDPEPA